MPEYPTKDGWRNESSSIVYGSVCLCDQTNVMSGVLIFVYHVHDILVPRYWVLFFVSFTFFFQNRDLSSRYGLCFEIFAWLPFILFCI